MRQRTRSLHLIRRILQCCVAIATLLTVSLGSAAAAPDYDIIIRNGTLIDGAGSPGVRADVAISGARIVKIAPGIKGSPGIRVIDAKGLVIAPGFVDMHAHIDPITKLPAAQSMVRQGVTTAIGGPDGSAPWPTGSHLARIERHGVGLNVAILVGHNSVRKAVMALDNRAPTEKELARMREMIGQSMDEGAWGISTGLKYLPGAYSKIDEVTALSKEAASRGGYYTSHLREEGLGLIDSVTEAIEIGRQAKIPIVLTHHKVIGQPMWGKSSETLAMVDAARAEGVDVMMDQYPYTATYTGITVLVPAWAREGGNSKFLGRLKDPETRARIKKEIVFNIENDRGGGDLRRVQFGLVKWQKDLEGKTLYDWAVMKGLEPNSETGAELVIEAIKNGGASCIYHVLDEKDVERIMRHPMTMIGSDGRLADFGVGHPHPRWYGAFPRVLGHYVREKKVLKLEDAIRKMTSLSAARVGLKLRGLVKEGYFADLVVFDPETIIDKANFSEPHQYPEGIHYVFVNGEAAVDSGEFQNLRAGRILRRGADTRTKVYPAKEWQRSESPKTAGWSKDKLTTARDYADTLKTSALMIVQGGRIVDEWGETERPFPCHSMRKSILSALFGPPVRSGKIDLNADLESLGIDDKEPSLTADEKKTTVGDLIKARSGIYHPALYETKAMAAKRPKRGSHAPGSFWYYNNWDFNALCTIFENQTGRGIFEEFEDRLAGPLGMQDFIRDRHTKYVTGDDSVHPAYPFQLSARDLARFGLLFARGGVWNGKQIIPRSWVVESTQTYSETSKTGGYGYMWWTAAKDSGEVPKGAFSANGYRGHRILVIPQWDLVIVHRVDTFEKEGSVSSAEFSKLVDLILKARPRVTEP
jgi:N-acyl-D-amino-acid deacylase